MIDKLIVIHGYTHECMHEDEYRALLLKYYFVKDIQPLTHKRAHIAQNLLFDVAVIIKKRAGK